MPVGKADVPLSAVFDPASHPRSTEAVLTLKEIGDKPVLARVAPDGTRWCRCCDLTAPAGKTSAFCSEHANDRRNNLKTIRRKRDKEAAEVVAAASPRSATSAVPVGKVLADVEALRFIAQQAHRMSAHVARASTHYRELNEPQWLNNLMLSAKDLDAAIEQGITNGTVLQRDTVVPRPVSAPSGTSRVRRPR